MSTISGMDKYMVGQVATKIRAFKKPNPYRGTGIKYKEIPLKNNFEVDIDVIPSYISKKTKMVFIQRSKGYHYRKSLTISDIERIISLIKSFALLNLWFRDKDGSTITANDDDIHEAFALWNKISVSQELNLPPYIYEIYEKLILPAYQEKSGKNKLGVTRQDIMKKHYQVYNNLIDDAKLRQQILPMLETAGLIIQEKNDPSDGRKTLIYPQTKNSESGGGVK